MSLSSISSTRWPQFTPVIFVMFGLTRWVDFHTKPEIALDQIREAVSAGLARGVILADAAYGINTDFRDGLNAL